MITNPPHNRKLGLCGVALTKQKNSRYDIKALTSVQDSVEKAIVDSGYLEGAVFSWVTIAIRFGLKNDNEPTYKAISKKYGDLPLAIEINANELLSAPLEQVEAIFEVAVLKALIHAGKKYGRPIDLFQKMLVKYEI